MRTVLASIFISRIILMCPDGTCLSWSRPKSNHASCWVFIMRGPRSRTEAEGCLGSVLMRTEITKGKSKRDQFTKIGYAAWHGWLGAGWRSSQTGWFPGKEKKERVTGEFLDLWWRELVRKKSCWVNWRVTNFENNPASKQRRSLV